MKSNMQENMEKSTLDAIEERLDAVQDILPEVSSLLRELQEEDLNIRTKSNDMDLVTRADHASEEKIVGIIKRRFGGDAILAEESGVHSQDQDSPFQWLIDPVDGTINYAHGLPLYGVSIGLMYRGLPFAGLVAFPALYDVYRAVQGRGATKNGKPISVSGEDQLSRSLIATGFPYNRAEILPRLMQGVEAVLKNARGIRRTGSASLDLCWMAEGRLDGLYELNLSPWDTCAGSVVVREAGGRVSDFTGEEHHPETRSIVATNKRIHDALLAILPR